MAPRTQALVLVGVCLTPAAAYLHAPLQRSALVRANIALSPLRPPIQSALRQPPTPIVTQQRRSGAVVASAAAVPQPNFARAARFSPASMRIARFGPPSPPRRHRSAVVSSPPM